jgi:predicted DNA-binding protein with PD1-like motif
MKYTVITKQGKVFTFFIKSVAETYQQAFGGVLFTAEVLCTVEIEVVQ